MEQPESPHPRQRRSIELKQNEEAVVRYGRIEVMDWAHRQGYSRIECDGNLLCMSAANYGQVAALQWLRQNGCDWDKYTFSFAAGGGHLSVL